MIHSRILFWIFPLQGDQILTSVDFFFGKVTENCINMMPLMTYLHAQDKHDLTHSAAERVVFDLDVCVFAKGQCVAVCCSVWCSVVWRGAVRCTVV